MSVRNVVKVMNFHSLLRVDSARKKAEKYFVLEEELTSMIDNIVNNKNFILDKKALKVNPKKPALNIYISNDYGFCGNFNFVINEFIKDGGQSQKIFIGKKIKTKSDDVLLDMSKDNFATDFYKIEEIIQNSINNLEHSSINVYYNHYYSVNNIKPVKKCIFPVDFKKEKKYTYDEDFVSEGDINSLLTNMVTLYICYEIKIAEINSWASENVMRQQITRESLKKIDERDEERQRITSKIKKYKRFQKNIESYLKVRIKEGDEK
jgi:F0F1-type ATP synthase gamma subunit